MSDINNLVIVGRLVRDVELKYTNGGTPIGSMSIANNKKTKKGNEWHEEVNFFDVIIWGNQAISCEKYLHKGSQVGVSGSIRQNKWNDKDGKVKSRVEIVANNIQFMMAKEQDKSGYNKPVHNNNNHPYQNNTQQTDPNDIPF